MTKSLNSELFQLGVCYYPEHWPESLWEDDYRRMRDFDFDLIRVGEFAWTIFEPEEGRFRFDLFDRALDLAHKHGLKAIMGTPTATPPAWLTHRYPEVLNAAQNGMLYRHGQRRHYNYNSKIYRELSSRIVRKLAEHYKDHPAVVGWQIDNELNCELNVFYSEADQAAFREWVQRKYGTLEALNAAWGAVFWNQTYTAWEQVRLTGMTPNDSPNPHQALDEKRFFSDSAISFCAMQSTIIRENAPNHWVTTNGLFGHLDSHRMTEECLDFFSYDSYPAFAAIYPDEGEHPLLDRKWSWNLSAARSISPNFCVMEQQAGPGGWVNRMEMPSPQPGQMRLWTYQSIAHGADMVLYFRWRTATAGTEIYWHGINDYHNRPNRRVAEAKQIGEELSRIGGSLAGSRFQAEAAIIRNYDNEWDGELDKWYGPLGQKSSLAWFKAFQHRHIPVDACYINEQTKPEQLMRYKLLVYPHPAIMPVAIAELLKDYVSKGGTVVFGCRSGYKDETGQCYMAPFPGPIADLCGIEVEDFSLIGPLQQAPGIEVTELGQPGETVEIRAEGFVDILQAVSPRAKVRGTFLSGWYAGKPAIVQHDYGVGRAVYYGSAFNEPSAAAIMDMLQLHSPLEEIVSLPREVEVSIRKKAAEQFIFLLNYSAEPQTIEIKQQMTELLSGKTLSGKVAMNPYEVLVITAK